MQQIEELRVYVPSVLDWDWLSTDEIVEDLTSQHRRFGFERFMLAFPNKGFRSSALPTVDYAKEQAARFREIKDRLAPLGISLGWWLDASVKAGHTEGFQYMIKENGTEAPYSPCPTSSPFTCASGKQIGVYRTLSVANATAPPEGEPNII